MFQFKKASLTDAIYGPVKLLGLAIAIFIGIYIWFSFTNVFSVMPINTPYGNNTFYNQSINNAINNVSVGLTGIDYVFPFVVMALLFVSLIFAFKTGAPVIYAVLSLVFWFLAMLLSALFANIFINFAASFPTISTQLPIITYIMTNIKWVVLFWLFLITIVMFTRPKKEQEMVSAQEAVFG